MKNLKYFAIVSLVLIAVYLVMSGGSASEGTDIAIEPQWSNQIVDQENITVSVTPIDLSESAEKWKFKVVIDTHSVELDQDLTASSYITDDNGNIEFPVEWDGSSPGGHHREGVLSFEAIEPFPSFLELRISDVGEAERLFQWNL